MPENKPNFLESIQFQEDFPPFKESTAIKFWWKDEVQRMIKFYLKNQNNLLEKSEQKTDKEISENVKRFKINCVLGNNWGGKSRLLRWLYAVENTTDIHEDINLIINQIDSLSVTKIDEKYTSASVSWEYQPSIILDDFFKLSSNNYFSVNNSILNEENLNKFYCDVYNNLNWKFWSIFSKFFKTSIDNFSLVFSIKNHRETIIDIESHSFYNFDEHEYLSICNKINYGWYIIFEIHQKLKNNFILEYFYYSIIKNIFCLVKSPLYSENEYNILAKEDLLWNLKKIEKILSLKERYSKKINTFIESVWKENYRELHHFILKNIEKQELWEIKKLDFKKLTKWEIETISSLFELNIKFNDLFDFNWLSAWEKTMLIRFTNIYEKILQEKVNWKTDFLILIDEPDLHLHLDWQRQYIQKLIDVFSTLDPEINLHFIIATHSPFIISDLPTECMVVLDKSEKNIHKGEFVEVKEYSKKDENWKFIHQTFGANYIDIIKNGFFFENKQMLMGSFSQNIIWDIAENERKYFTDDKELDKNHENIKNNIWDDFLKDNLLYFKPEK